MPRKINRIGMFAATLAFALIGINASARGAAFAYVPATVAEFHSAGIVGDDDCDAAGAVVAPAITLLPGDTLTWTYAYGASPTGYKVTSNDKADIEVLELRAPAIVGGGIVTKLKVELMSGGAVLGVYNLGNITWAGNRCAFRQNDVLGKIKTALMPITGFRIVATQVAGTVSVDSMTFRWEAGEIHPWP